VHAELHYQGGLWVLRDLGSANGTTVNGRRVAGAAVVREGEQVGFGDMTYRLSADWPLPGPPPAPGRRAGPRVPCPRAVLPQGGPAAPARRGRATAPRPPRPASRSGEPGWGAGPAVPMHRA